MDHRPAHLLIAAQVSDHANSSRHIPRELERAVDGEIPIIPFRIENVRPRRSLEYSLSSLHWLDAITPPVEAHVKALATTLRSMRDSRPQEATTVLPPAKPAASGKLDEHDGDDGQHDDGDREDEIDDYGGDIGEEWRTLEEADVRSPIREISRTGAAKS